MFSFLNVSRPASSIPKQVELVANVAIVIIAILLGFVLVKRFILPQSSKPAVEERAQIAPGTKLSLPGVDWSKGDKTLLMVLSTNCHFCNESAPFYKRLIEAVKDKNVKLVAVFPTSIEESKAHLNELGLTNLEVERSPLENIQVRGTPTLILTNEKGEVMDFWIGKLTPDKETEVINKLNS